ncbi:PREDICTED: uncharacterized protein LOC104802892 [Tarenaya hassleriana]|uniref:uncharacterized protein LOC104802892 n=1 Tax=Tarenaya hassleriana TaxID=28532 RepID=UPI00053C6A8D|nr:PREDICTED: uncharacterized protein LOC104802892 [Tarenaya hassleriana]
MSGLHCVLCASVQSSSSGVEGYWCVTCFGGNFHRECAESPMELKDHPYHPPHPLSLRPLESSDICRCCGGKLGKEWAYSCSTCTFFMHLKCAKKPPVLEVDQPKSHVHKLFLLPKPRLFTCDACGLLLDGPILPWACLECGVMFHRECIDLPRVIRISRHPQHRLFYVFSPSPPPPHESSSWSCGVCRKVVHNHYGAYSCVKENCRCTVHSKCATREDVWDGIDLYGVPEEPEDVEAPFEVIDDKVIRHFSHQHHLKLNEDDDISSGRSEFCEICALPTHTHIGNIYRCITGDCDFVIHETCANLPRKMWYMLHPHRLELQAFGTSSVVCDVCDRECCGFIYKCCNDCGFIVDVNCASVSEPFIHTNHPHPLFSTSISNCYQTCSGCKGLGTSKRKKMECIECDSVILCFRCITLPTKVRYKQDRHPLVLGGGGGEAKDGGSWWCEICEGKMEPEEEMYYTCDTCCVTVHVHCILGEGTLMKPGHYSHPWAPELEVAANNSRCRPLCHQCQRRCPFPSIFKTDDHVLCTFRCVKDFRRTLCEILGQRK